MSADIERSTKFVFLPMRVVGLLAGLGGERLFRNLLDDIGEVVRSLEEEPAKSREFGITKSLTRPNDFSGFVARCRDLLMCFEDVGNCERDEQGLVRRRESFVIELRSLHLEKVKATSRQAKNRPREIVSLHLQAEQASEEGRGCFNVRCSSAYEPDSQNLRIALPSVESSDRRSYIAGNVSAVMGGSQATAR